MTPSNFRNMSIVLVGLAVPLLVIGRSVLAVALGLGVIGLLMADRRRRAWRFRGLLNGGGGLRRRLFRRGNAAGADHARKRW